MILSSRIPCVRIECLFKFGLVLSGLCIGLASPFNPSYATELDLTIRKSLLNIDSSGVIYKNERRNEAWLNSESDIINHPMVSIRIDRQEAIGAEYRHQFYSFNHEGQYGKLVCSFFGCSYAGSKLLNENNSSDIVKLSIRSHAIFLNNVLPPNQIFSNVDISIGYLTGSAHLVGFDTSSNQQGGLPTLGVPTLGVRLGRLYKLSEASKLQANFVPAMFYGKNGHVGLSELDVLYSYTVINTFYIGIGLVSTWHHLKYKKVDYLFRQESNILNPFFQINYRFK